MLMFYKHLVKNPNKLLNLPGFHVCNVKMDTSQSSPYLSEDQLKNTNPFILFDNWYTTACDNKIIPKPNAMSLSTVNQQGHPTSRMVILGSYGESGFKFYTGYNSNKAKDLERTPFAALILYWADLFRSVRIEGEVEKLTAAENSEYFSQMPKPVQIVAVASEHQSGYVKNVEQLNKMAKEIEEKYSSEEIPCPIYWGGYKVIPTKFEFWTGSADIMSDRIVFVKDGLRDKEEWKQAKDGWFYQHTI